MVILDHCCGNLKDVVLFSTPKEIINSNFELDENYMIADLGNDYFKNAIWHYIEE